MTVVPFRLHGMLLVCKEHFGAWRWPKGKEPHGVGALRHGTGERGARVASRV